MNRFDLILVILTPVIILFSFTVLHWIPIHFAFKFFGSLIIIPVSFIVTLVLPIRRGYRSSDVLNILLGPIFSLIGFIVFLIPGYYSFNIFVIVLESILAGFGIALSFIRLRKNPPQGRSGAEEPIYETTEDGIPVPSTVYTQPAKPKGSFRRTLRVWRSPILYFVTFAIVGVIAMFILRPIPAGNDILTNIAMGIGFGVLGACCFIGSGRTKFVRE